MLRIGVYRSIERTRGGWPLNALVAAVPKAPGISRWTKVYDDFVGSHRLRKLQNQIGEAENECLRSQNVRFKCQQRLIILQDKLKNLHSKLQETSTTDKAYPALFAEELRALKEVRAVAYDFHLYEEMERENFLQLEEILSKDRTEQLRKSRRSDQFLFYACLVGLTVGILGTVTSLYLQNYLHEDPTNASQLFRQLAVELTTALESKNTVVRAFLQDLAIVLETGYGIFFPHGTLVVPSSEDESAGATSLLKNMAAVFSKYNNENETEMNRLRQLLVHDRLQVPEPVIQILPTEPSEVKAETDIGPLWKTTFVYSLLVVIVPVAYSLLT